jgi:hypothetical protein
LNLAPEVPRINRRRTKVQLAESRGQLACEWLHLPAKLRARGPDWLSQWNNVVVPEQHPLFWQFRVRCATGKKSLRLLLPESKRSALARPQCRANQNCDCSAGGLK